MCCILIFFYILQIQGLLLLPRQPFTQKAHCNGSEKQWARCGYDRRRRQRWRSRQVRRCWNLHGQIRYRCLQRSGGYDSARRQFLNDSECDRRRQMHLLQYSQFRALPVEYQYCSAYADLHLDDP